VERNQIDEFNIPNQTIAQFDANELQGNLIIRSKKPGDRMELPDGSGSSKLKELFINMKVPKSLRQIWPIVADQQGAIIWVPGLRRASRALIREQTTKAIVIHFLDHDD
jgi:tRNA(Ile)-lysidine synthase